MASPPLPPTMHAWLRQRRGPARTSLELATSYPTPSLPSASSAEVLIRVSHVALQFSSEVLFKTLPVIPFTAPSIPELEFTGTVVAAGSAASSDVREVGTRVVAYQNIPDMVLFGRGALVEYVRIPSSQAARLPEGSDMVAMGGVLGSGSTALKMARTGGVKEDHRVLVNGASGSVGKVLLQICKMRGAKVVGVASGGNEEMVRGLGADEVCFLLLVALRVDLRDFMEEDGELTLVNSSSTTASTTRCRPTWRRSTRQSLSTSFSTALVCRPCTSTRRRTSNRTVW
jgi:NADPH:quinone reductase-like Zn-dependent oxidoreductase